jgi:hypothetical protein
MMVVELETDSPVASRQAFIQLFSLRLKTS